MLPPRLVNTHKDRFTRALLASADRDEPSSNAYAKVSAAIGVAVGVSSAAVNASAASGASGAGSASTLLMVKAVFIGAVSGLSVLGGAAYVMHTGAFGSAPVSVSASAPARPTSAARGPRAVSRVAPPAPAAAVAEEAPEPMAANANPVLELDPEVNAPSSAVPVPAAELPKKMRHAHALSARARALRRAPHKSVAVTRADENANSNPATLQARSTADSSLPAQVAALDRARVALSTGDSGRSLRELAEYQRAWPRGVFVTEAKVLEIDALLKRGERPRALQLARAFVLGHPDDPRSERLRTLFAADD